MSGTGRRYVFLGLIVVFALLAAACGNKSETGQSAAAAQAAADGPVVTVRIKNFKFEPAEIHIRPGTRVVWVNEDATPHNVHAGTAADVRRAGYTPAFASPELAPGESWEYVFTAEGEFDYVCTVAGHYLMGMAGKVTVSQDAPAEQAAADATASAGAAADAAAEHAGHGTHAVAVAASLDPAKYIVRPEGLVELQPFRVEGNVKEFALDIQEIQHELIDGVVVTAWAFNGVLPGPTLRVTEGDRVRVHFTNTHHQPHTIHWHGIYADQVHDGVPHTSAPVMPGETRVYEFVADKPGTFVYHCHVDSYRHVDLGMYGAVIVEPKDGPSWDREYTIILDDWDSEVDPLATIYKPQHNYFVINGKAFPATPTLTLPVGETTRIRLINIGYSNVAMHMHGPSFTVVATDGHTLAQPYEKDTLDIAPGERYEIEVRPYKAGLYPFHAHNLQYVLNNGLYPGGMHIMIDIVDPQNT